MMCRYLLAVGAVSPAIVERLRLRVGNLLPIQSVSRAAHLFASALAPVMPLPEIDGWLLGTLFSSDGRTHVTSLSSPSQLAVVSTGGRNLIDHYSGSYMAFWSPGQEDAALLRDPTATMPILTTIVEGVMLVASDLAILAATLNEPLTIDWSALAHRLRYPNLPSAQTCIESIVEILPGQLWSWQSGQIGKDQIWQPGTFGLPAKTSADVSVDPRELGAAIDSPPSSSNCRAASILPFWRRRSHRRRSHGRPSRSRPAAPMATSARSPGLWPANSARR
jgi:asparagine synthase (glutamine-hydrolysing)